MLKPNRTQTITIPKFIMQFFYQFLLPLTLAVSTVYGYSATLYSAYDCPSGNNIGGQSSFGCGGTCYTYDDASSIKLEYSGSGHKPTANCYVSSDCSGASQHLGIESGHTTGCTNDNIGADWKSCYFYYDC